MVWTLILLLVLLYALGLITKVTLGGALHLLLLLVVVLVIVELLRGRGSPPL